MPGLPADDRAAAARLPIVGLQRALAGVTLRVACGEPTQFDETRGGLEGACTRGAVTRRHQRRQ